MCSLLRVTVQWYILFNASKSKLNKLHSLYSPDAEQRLNHPNQITPTSFVLYPRSSPADDPC